MKNNGTAFGAFSICLSLASLGAQPPGPPSPDPAKTMPASTVSDTIAQFNYGREGMIDGFLLSSNNRVHLPPGWAAQLDGAARKGDHVPVTGPVTPAAAGMGIVEAQAITVAGMTLSMARATQPAPYAGSGVVAQLNYGRQGEVNGFVMRDGILARTPPCGANSASALKPGASISLSGFARVTPAGKSVVDVQSLTANGQTVAMNMQPGPGPGHGPPHGRRDQRGPRGGPATMPPPPPPR